VLIVAFVELAEIEMMATGVFGVLMMECDRRVAAGLWTQTN
jgi:hypothetical protein